MTVNSALLQGGKDLWESHGGCHNAKAFVSRHVHWVFHGSHFQALQVGRLINGSLAVGHVSNTVFGPSQGLETFSFEFGKQLLANGTV